MSNVKNFNEFINENYMISESVSLTQTEKDFLWAKMETKKKAKAKDTENDIFQYLQGSKSIPSSEEFLKVLNSLEYSMKKKVKEGTAPKGKYEAAIKTLQSKLPSEWSGVKFSSLKAKETRDNKKPTSTSSKKDIQAYLKKKSISFDEKDKKEDLLSKI